MNPVAMLEMAHFLLSETSSTLEIPPPPYHQGVPQWTTISHEEGVES
jgi:hypothetical protein